MGDKIFLIGEKGELRPMAEKPYDTECVLQMLLERYSKAMKEPRMDPNLDQLADEETWREFTSAPGMPTFGFVIHHGVGASCRKLVICTDFYDYANILDEFVDADFIFVESNYDAELLHRHPNEASHFHMSNPRTASLLFHAVKRSKRAPQAVMLGHVSRERNRKKLALRAVEEIFGHHDMELTFKLSAARRFRPSKTIRIT